MLCFEMLLRAQTSAWILMLGSLGLANVAQAVEMAESVVAVASDQELESVLVSSRKATSPAKAAIDTSNLEPIPEDSEHQPELADPEATLSPPKAEEEPKAEEKGKTDQLRIASRAKAVSNPKAEVDEVYRKYTGPKPAKFHGVMPGRSTYDDLIREWGDLEESEAETAETDGGLVVSYPMAPFERVEALITDDVVQLIRVTLAKPASNASLIDLIGLDQIETVEILEPNTGELIGITFPEKGLTLLAEESQAPGSTNSTHLVLQPHDAQAFRLRAENRPEWDCEPKIADLSRAIEIDPENAHTHWLLANVYRYTGQDDLAEASASEAVRLNPEETAYRMCWAECLAAMKEYDRAVLQTRQVLDDGSCQEIVRAQALAAFGRLASLGEATIADKAIGFHNMAIEIADRLATSTDDAERQLAKRLLVSSHLDIAREVARRDYNNKANVVAEWVGRASSFAEEAIENDHGGLSLRLQVAREALAALAVMRPTKDPDAWIEEAEQTAQLLLKENDDALHRARIEWDLGLAYLYATQTAHNLGDADAALQFGSKAIDRLSAGAEPRAASPVAEATVGQLYFAIGAVNAVHKKDHQEAVVWYDKARPIYEVSLNRENELVAPRQTGEALVSMAVSYWQTDQRSLGLELTTRGAELMEQGVASNVLDQSALAVPYGNLESMHRRLGDAGAVEQYASLAREALGTEGVSDSVIPELGPTPNSKQKAESVVAKRSPSNQEATAKAPAKAKKRRATARRPTPRGTIVR